MDKIFTKYKYLLQCIFNAWQHFISGKKTGDHVMLPLNFEIFRRFLNILRFYVLNGSASHVKFDSPQVKQNWISSKRNLALGLQSYKKETLRGFFY